MGIFRKVRHEAENAGGFAKENAGRARGDRPLEYRGKRAQRRASFKKAGEHVKDALKKK